MLELKVFQSNAAKQIADRFAFFTGHPDRPMKGTKPRPFFQALSALTGAGKTPILAQAVANLRGHLVGEPIILWMSKARSVVGQTLSNFSESGKYSHLVEGFKVLGIGDISPPLIADGSTPLIITTTTGLFNNREQSEGALHIYKKDNDLFGESSPWERLITRRSGLLRRPLIIVYDEGHNLSEQQAEILAELEPDAYLLASATLRLPPSFQKSVVQPVRLWAEEAEDADSFGKLGAVSKSGEIEPELFITTVIDSNDVVIAQLVKLALQFEGTTASMDRSIDDLFQRLGLLESEVSSVGIQLRPKAIYVCKTNITDDGGRDDASLPFSKREAPPIRIWRYLVEQKGVDPSEIAIYANLTFEEGAKPDVLNLFSKGENDFDAFSAGNYRHIIFNLGLQEGWDDPECYLAYIDKSMGSAVQVEQVMGRVLRQYQASHYESTLLNTAHFFVRVDKESVFSEAIQRVRDKLAAEGAPITITDNFGGGGSASEDIEPREDVNVSLHHVFVDSEAARHRIGELLENFPVFKEGDENTVAGARAASAIVELLPTENEPQSMEWHASGYTNPVRLRWLVNTAIKSRSSRVLAIADLSSAKFDVRVQVQSKADKLVETLANEVVGEFYALSDLVYESIKEFRFGPIRVGKGATNFNHSLYPKYSGLNKLEAPFAAGLDETGFVWHRNPSSGGFFIPLLSEGDTASFYPDFIVWKGDMIYCLDTKGGHLLSDAVARKLFDIKEDHHTRILTRFITNGRQKELRGKALAGGYTVWKMKTGAPKPAYFDNLPAAIEECLK